MCKQFIGHKERALSSKNNNISITQLVRKLCEALEPREWLVAAGAYPGFCSMKRLGVFLLPLDGMLVHRRSLPRDLLGFPNNSPVPIYTPGWREAL